MTKTFIYLFIISFCLAALWFRSQNQKVTPIKSEVSVTPTPSSVTATPVPIQTITQITQQKSDFKIKGIPIEVLREQSEDPSYLPFDAEGNLYVEHVIVDGEFA